MRCLILSFRGGADCAALVFALGLAGPVLAGDQPGKIQFSDPATPITISNLNGLGLDKSFSKELEEDRFRPFESLKQGNSLDPVMPPFRPVNPQPTPSERQRELMDQRRNWAFIDSADLLPKAGLEDMLHVKELGPDGKEKQSLNSIEKYYENSGKTHRPGAIELSQQPGAGLSRDFAGTNMFNPAHFAYSTNESAWSIPAGENGAGSLAPWATTNSGSLAAEHAREQQHRSEFNALLDGRAAAPLVTPSPLPTPFAGPAGSFGFPASSSPAAGGVASFASPAAGTMPANIVAPVEYRSPASPMFGTAAQVPNQRPHVLDDPTLRALGLPQPQTQSRFAETNKSLPTVERAAEFSLPQRKF